jgi:hypothetical protein
VSAQLKTLALESAEEQECSGTRSGSDAAGVRRPEAGGLVGPWLVVDVAGLLRKHGKDEERRATVAKQRRIYALFDPRYVMANAGFQTMVTFANIADSRQWIRKAGFFRHRPRSSVDRETGGPLSTSGLCAGAFGAWH